LLAIKTLVIIDDTNDYRSMRKPYFRLAQMKRVKYLEIHF
jgi:tRNA uridine 5-carbamoylmethylation protein Kti12